MKNTRGVHPRLKFLPQPTFPKRESLMNHAISSVYSLAHHSSLLLSSKSTIRPTHSWSSVSTSTAHNPVPVLSAFVVKIPDLARPSSLASPHFPQTSPGTPANAKCNPPLPTAVKICRDFSET